MQLQHSCASKWLKPVSRIFFFPRVELKDKSTESVHTRGCKVCCRGGETRPFEQNLFPCNLREGRAEQKIKWCLAFLWAQSSIKSTVAELMSAYLITTWLHNHPIYNFQIVLVRMDGPKYLIPGELLSVNMTRWCKTGGRHGKVATRKAASHVQRNKQTGRRNVCNLPVPSTLNIIAFKEIFANVSAGITSSIQEKSAEFWGQTRYPCSSKNEHSVCVCQCNKRGHLFHAAISLTKNESGARMTCAAQTM